MAVVHLVAALRSSSSIMTGKERHRIAAHASGSRGVTEKSSAAQGTYRMKLCRSMERLMAPSSHRFAHGGNLQPHLHLN